MAADRIRLTISITPEVHELFSQMAETAGMSLGKCIGDWLTDTAEGAQFVANKMAEARRAPRVVMREMQAMALGLVDEANATMEQLRRETSGRPDARSAPSARPAAGAPPRPVIRGGKSPEKGKTGRAGKS